MRKFLLSATAALALLGPIAAHAATITYGTFTLVGPPSVSASCTLPTTDQYPLAANTVICPIVVTPSNWTGTISNPVGGADSAKFVVVPNPSGPGSVLENSVILNQNGSAAGTNAFVIGTSTLTP